MHFASFSASLVSSETVAGNLDSPSLSHFPAHSPLLLCISTHGLGSRHLLRGECVARRPPFYTWIQCKAGFSIDTRNDGQFISNKSVFINIESATFEYWGFYTIIISEDFRDYSIVTQILKFYTIYFPVCAEVNNIHIVLLNFAMLRFNDINVFCVFYAICFQ